MNMRAFEPTHGSVLNLHTGRREGGGRGGGGGEGEESLSFSLFPLSNNDNDHSFSRFSLCTQPL